MKNHENDNLNTHIERYFAIKIRLSLKMQKITKQRSRQLFETVNFGFIKFFDFIVKTAIFRAFLLFS